MLLSLSSIPVIRESISASPFLTRNECICFFVSFLPAISFLFTISCFTSTGSLLPSTRILFTSFKTAYFSYKREAFGSTRSPDRYVHFPTMFSMKFLALSFMSTFVSRFHGITTPASFLTAHPLLLYSDVGPTKYGMVNVNTLKILSETVILDSSFSLRKS